MPATCFPGFPPPMMAPVIPIDYQVSYNAVQRYVDGAARVQEVIPFGKAFLTKVVAQFVPLRTPFVYKNLSHPQRRLITKCQAAYVFFMERKNKKDMYWIEHHEQTRKRLTSFISSNEPYRMEGAEIAVWCDDVFFLIKKVSRQFLKPQNEVQGHASERQLCVDALYQLIQLARDSDDRNKFLKYYAHLVILCQKASLSPSSFVIKLPTLSAREPIETGASAQVLHGYYNNQEVAVKRFRLYSRTISKIRQRFLKESSILQLLQHPNVVPFIGVVREGLRLCIVSPWMKNGDINAFIKQSPDVCRKELIEQVADGLHFLSGHNIVHGDLKGANVLINDAEKACIADFGIASIQEYTEPLPLTELEPYAQQALLRKCREVLKEGGMSVTLASSLSSRMSSFSGAGTYRWMAPERLIPEALDMPSAKPTFASDVFSLAMLAIEVYSGEVPFHGDNQNVAFLNTIAGRRPPRPPNVPDMVWRLVEECWTPQPTQRPDIWNIYNRLACIP